MTIAILGWGSLIPEPRDLRLDAGWHTSGPTLRIEFSRISADGRLTLVIDREHGSEVVTQYARSARSELEDAVCDLMIREGASRSNIGVCSTRETETRRCNNEESLPTIREWLKKSEFDAVIWTDLKSNFAEKRHVDFSPDAAFNYLNNLSDVCKANARDYINRAPQQTETALRQQLRARGWL